MDNPLIDFIKKRQVRLSANICLCLMALLLCCQGLFSHGTSALYTIISIFFAMSYVVDMLHTSHQKVTALIITTKAESVGKNISKHVFRGFIFMTLLPSVGGYSGVPGNMIMMVVTRYEIYDLENKLF